MTIPRLDPEFAHLAEFDAGIGAATTDLTEIRAALADLIEPPPPVEGVVAGQVRVGTTTNVTVETFSPEGVGPHPALLWFHGGGYVLGSAGMDAPRLQSWSKRFGCLTASVEYRLAPDHPFPAAHNDGVDALDWLIRSADDLSVDLGRIVVAGASAGGGLAAGVALAARDRHIRLAGQLLFYPMLDDRLATPSSQWSAPVWSRAANEFGWRAYLGADYAGDVGEYAAPARAASFAGLPPTMLIVGGADGFFDDTLAYASRLTHAGVPTDVRVYAGTPHGFDLVAPESITSRAAVGEAERWLAGILGQP